MTPFWIANVAAWGIVLAYATPSAFAAAFKQSHRRGDPMRLAVWLVSFVMAAGCLRWLIASDSLNLWRAVYVIAFATALYVFRLMIAYGRGGNV